MKPWEIIARADGLELAKRDDEFVIRANGRVLMSSRQHGSEEQMAEVLESFASGSRIDVLVGGLGMGFTLRAVLDRLKASDAVTVAEISPAVVEWNRDQLASLAGNPLADPRTAVVISDVRDVLQHQKFHAVLLDIDNGPEALSVASNDRLYSTRGIRQLQGAITSGGVAVIWSAAQDAGFERRMRLAGFSVERKSASARGAKRGTTHTLYIAKRN